MPSRWIITRIERTTTRDAVPPSTRAVEARSLLSDLIDVPLAWCGATMDDDDDEYANQHQGNRDPIGVLERRWDGMKLVVEGAKAK
jgi:hypothetical protein